ncbi:Pvc16 family protein [Mycetocola sp. 2940]|uniref:Pvc16 family protein n=1 Tax=Mycetocola sp. 2940 TaxID=3156452 RepID=UPI0033950C75
MPTLSTYGQAIASTTVALQQLLSAAPAKLQVTARTPDAARIGISGASVNLFLYHDDLTGYRDGHEPPGTTHNIAELFYLLSAYPGDTSDADAVSHRAFGTARSVVQQSPVLPVPLGERTTNVQLRSHSISTDHLTALWLASAMPLRLSFGIVATFTVSG